MSKYLTELKKFIDTRPYSVIRVSEIIGDGDPETLEYTPANPCQNLYSVAKSVTMTAIGLLYDKGLIKPEDKICDILKDEMPAKYDERWHITTVDMALRHRIGLPGGFLDIDCNKSSLFTDDYLKYMFEYPLLYTPDTDSAYTDGAFYLLARIAEKICGDSLENFLWKEMLLPLDCQEIAWSHCPKGHCMGATGLYMHSADIVKIGAIYLNGGTYKGKRYLSEDWVNIVLERGYTLNPDKEKKVWSKGGMCGQSLMIIPSQNRAVCIESFGGNCSEITEFTLSFK